MTTETESDTTLDAFHRGRFYLVQPKKQGHRAGLDAMLLASALPRTFTGTVVDLGAGSGAAGLGVLSRCPQAKAVLVENAPVMIDCAAKTLMHPQNAGLASRASLVSADAGAAAQSRRAAGLADHSAHAVILNPPFNDPRDRSTTDPLRREAHVMTQTLLEDWLRTAAAMSKAGAWCAMIFRPRHLTEALSAMSGRFGGLGLRFVQARPMAPAIRLIIRGRRNDRAPLTVHPPLVLHGESGSAFAPEADALINGEADFFPAQPDRML
ncbi:tRNA1(Val) (adenine(37)-N6)-methyltransferase [Notoacmeibacter sp. MSK16QG-6]|uniref:tRNA1(Val) (adenine(37)-N6)-methyltransferase n=1 Tax=Notoacmeibacter sp. MSK16QG-6 TaxID=2957982 RepID=UPI0020A1CD12|nr:methyltransferase [Notoacmeibacter sp. MSK16QG-6]MCP1198257.1 methyltransferase [Notoacmeibacter sp. MSK16QG-6]